MVRHIFVSVFTFLLIKEIVMVSTRNLQKQSLNDGREKIKLSSTNEINVLISVNIKVITTT